MNIEVVKLLLESAKSKMYIFGAGMGGTFAYLVKENNSFMQLILFVILGVSTIGFLKNLSKIAKLERELERIEND